MNSAKEENNATNNYKKERPDNIVFNEDQQKYDAALKPFGTNVGAPTIRVQDNNSWKEQNVHRVNKKLKAQFLQIKKQYDAMLEELEYNNLVYNAQFKFRPIVGETYHLYRNTKQEPFLSIIAPKECSFDFIGSFYLNHDMVWKKVCQESNLNLPLK